MSAFDDMLNSIYAPSAPAAGNAGAQAAMAARQRSYASGGGQMPFNYDTMQPGSAWGSPAMGGAPSAPSSGLPGGTDWIQKGYAPAFQAIEQSSKGAGDLVRQGYENAFRARAGGIVGGFDESKSRLQAAGATSGLSGDVLGRMLYAPGMSAQGQIGQARAETESGSNFDLAQLLKGTGSELAGLTQAQLTTISNYLAAKMGAKAAEQAGSDQMLGALGGGLIKAFL